MMGFKFREVNEINETKEDKERRETQDCDLAILARSIKNKEMDIEELDKPIVFDINKK